MILIRKFTAHVYFLAINLIFAALNYDIFLFFVSGVEPATLTYEGKACQFPFRLVKVPIQVGTTSSYSGRYCQFPFRSVLPVPIQVGTASS